MVLLTDGRVCCRVMVLYRKDVVDGLVVLMMAVFVAG